MKDKYKFSYMRMAKVFSETSEAKRLKVAALIVKDDKIISLGVNGTISGWDTNCCEDNDGNTSWFVKHAEQAALNKLRKSHESSLGADMFITHSPCLNCCLDIIDSGIKKVYFSYFYRDKSGIDLLLDNGVDVEQIVEKFEY